MPEIPYQNREIKDMFDDLKQSNARIEKQVITTNGRVTALERWKYMGMGATAVLTLVIVPILSWSLWVLVNIQDTVHQSVDRALSAHSINVPK